MEENRPSRKFIPIGIRLQACLYMLGFDPMNEEIEWDHFPAIGLRAVNEDGTDYEPRQLDPRYIRPMRKADHLVKTSGRKGESKFSSNGGGDTSRVAKAKRLLEETEERLRKGGRMVGERRDRKGTIQSRGFSKEVTRTFNGKVKPRKIRRNGH
jgi:hypothetical protein